VRQTFTLMSALLASTALAACGGGGEDSSNNEASNDAPAESSASSEMNDAMETAAAETESAAADMEAAAEDAADDVAAASEDAMSGAEDAMSEAEDAMADASDAMSGAMEDAADAVGDAADAAAAQAGEAMGAASDEDGLRLASFTADAGNGRRVFIRCQTCHVIEEGVNRQGPSLYGIFGREAGTVEGFRYSPANADSGIVWTKQIMFEYLEDPQEFIPGTYMAFPGLPDPQDRADVIAYIAENGGEAG